jgi:hypothetical protein
LNVYGNCIPSFPNKLRDSAVGAVGAVGTVGAVGAVSVVVTVGNSGILSPIKF